MGKMVKINLNNITNERIYVKLNPDFVNFLSNIIKKSNFYIDEKYNQVFYNIKYGKKCSLNFLKDFSKLIDIPFSDFEENIELITSCKHTNIGIKNPKLPFNFKSKDAIRFIASIFGDGELNSQIHVRYNNQNKFLINQILDSAKQIFGDVDYKIYFRKDKTYQLHFPKIIGLIMLNLGLKPGYKSMNNAGIPDYIKKLNKKIISVFIRQFFSDEGNIRLRDRRLQVKQTLFVKDESKSRIRLNPEKYCHKILLDIKDLLNLFGIDSKLYLASYIGQKASWELSIFKKENLEIFYREIGFDLKYKMDLLKKAIKSYKFPSCSKNGRINFALKHCGIVQEKYGYIDKMKLSKESKRSLKTAAYYLVDLSKKDKVKIIEKPRTDKGTSLPFKYQLIS